MVIASLSTPALVFFLSEWSWFRKVTLFPRPPPCPRLSRLRPSLLRGSSSMRRGSSSSASCSAISPVSLQSEKSSDSVAEECDLSLLVPSFSSMAEVNATAASSVGSECWRRWRRWAELLLGAMVTGRAVSRRPSRSKRMFDVQVGLGRVARWTPKMLDVVGSGRRMRCDGLPERRSESRAARG